MQKHLLDEVLYQELYQELAQFEELVEQGISSRWLEQFFMIIYEKSEKIEPIGDLKQLFLELKRKNYKIGLATSDTLPATMLIMEYLGLTEMFDFIATGDRYYRNQMRPCSKPLSVMSIEVDRSNYGGIRSWMFSWELVMAKQELVF